MARQNSKLSKVYTATLPKGYSPNTQLKRRPRKPKKALKIIKLDSKWYVNLCISIDTSTHIEPCHVVSTKWHRTLISTCLQDCWFWLDSIIFRCRQQPAAEERGTGLWKLRVQCLKKNSGLPQTLPRNLPDDRTMY